MQISNSRAQVSSILDFAFHISGFGVTFTDFEVRISHFDIQISVLFGFRIQISDIWAFEFSDFISQVSDFKFARNLVNIAVFACVLQKTL